MKKKKLFFSVFIAISIGLNAQLQDKWYKPEFSLNMMNSHLWRGIEVEDGLIFTPDFSIADPSKHFRVGIWGAFNTDGSFKEFDYYLKFEHNGFHTYIWDVYNFSPGADYNNEEFFNYKARSTGRFVDVTVGYTFNKLPLTLNWSTIIFGRDRDALNNKNRYSTFVIAEYCIYKDTKWKFEGGLGGAFALHKGKNEEGKTTSKNFFGDKPGIVQVNLKTIYNLTVLKHEMPIYLNLMMNPLHDTGFIQLGVELLRF